MGYLNELFVLSQRTSAEVIPLGQACFTVLWEVQGVRRHCPCYLSNHFESETVWRFVKVAFFLFLFELLVIFVVVFLIGNILVLWCVVLIYDELFFNWLNHITQTNLLGVFMWIFCCRRPLFIFYGVFACFSGWWCSRNPGVSQLVMFMLLDSKYQSIYYVY